MANNALIQGAARTSKKFVDIGGAVGKALSSLSVPTGSKSRVDENKAIQARVNNYMSKMKTDMDFTSFSPEETATMRNFLLQQRSVYAEAAKMAAKFDDTTDPEYMNYVDQMQGVNNSFTNLASQLKSYKQGKLDYAQNQLEGLYSNGNEPSVNNNAATIFGFIDEDQDKRTDKRLDSPFQILQGGNLGFNIDGNEISYNDMPMPGLKDNKLANSILTKNEAIYNQGLQGGELNPEMLKAYELNLDDQLQNRDALRSIVFDYESEIGIFNKKEEIENSVALKNGTLSYDDLRKKVVSRLVNARKGVFNSGKSIYNAKKENQPNSVFTLAPSQIASNNDATSTLNAWVEVGAIGKGKKFGYIVRSPKDRATQKKRDYEITKTKDGKYYLGGNGTPELLSPELAKEMFNIDLK
jgi:uncharacterized membrane protein YcgQ (UPF0703/DUF1980 family)